MTQFIAGQKAELNKFTSSLELTIGISLNFSSPTVVDVSCFGVDDNGKLSDDRYMIFFNQKSSPCNSVSIITKQEDDLETFLVNLSSLPATIKKLVFTASIDGNHNMSSMISGYIRIAEGNNNIIQFSFIGSEFDQQKAIMVGELYLKNVWRFNAIGQGFNGGLSALLKHFGGGEIETQNPTPNIVSEFKPKPATTVNLVKGKVSLKKGDKSVIIEKTEHITATVSWKSGTDYDIYALVMLRSGKEIAVATFGAQGVPPLKNYGNGKVSHRGDVKDIGASGIFKNKTNTEIIDIRLCDDIVAVIPVAYSAQSNGTGSFYRYKVSLSINNGLGASVEITASNANNNDRIYTCVPGIIYNRKDGVNIEYLEYYSAPKSENRPSLRLNADNSVDIFMDAGPLNYYK